MSQSTPSDGAITAAVRELLPDLQALYIFGSRAHGQEWDKSDLDLGVLLPDKADVVFLWDVAQELACRFNIDIDLIDIRVFNPVLQHQVLVTGRLLFVHSGINMNTLDYSGFSNDS